MTDLEERARDLVAVYPTPAGALHTLVDLVLGEGGAWDEESARWVAHLTGVPQAVVNGIISSRLKPDGDGEVDSTDLFAILAAGKYNAGSSAATWLEGDMDGDDDVDSTDLFLILATG